MQIVKCPHCAEFLHFESDIDSQICWNCHGFVAAGGAPTWDQEFSNWLEEKTGDPANVWPMIVPLVLLLMLMFLRNPTGP